MSAISQCVAVLGGSFDPVHNGHIAIAGAALSELGADSVLMMPAKNPPHKQGYQAGDGDRLAMIKLAISAEPRIQVDTSELEQARTSYSVLSMQAFRKSLGDRASICFLMGWDSLQTIDTWWHWQTLFELVNIVVVRRPGYDGIESEIVRQVYDQRLVDIRELKTTLSGGIAILDMPAYQISSSDLRNEIKSGNGVTHNALPNVVNNYIQEQGLYGCQSYKS